MTQYTVLHCHSDASLLDGAATTKDIAKRYTEIGCTAGAITNHGTFTDNVSFAKEMKSAGLKCIHGIELYVCDEHSTIQTNDNRKLTHLVILSKNLQGWKQLLKISNAMNNPKSYYYKPRLSLEELSQFLDGNIIGFSGHLGSHIANAVMQYGVNSGVRTAKYMEGLFGKGNFWLETQLFDKDHNKDMAKCTQLVRQVSQQTGIPVIATPDSHYAWKHQAEIQRILLCSNMHTTLSKAVAPDFPLRGFFISDNYYIPSYEDMIKFGHTPEELAETNKIADQIEDYTVLSEPQLPKFDCPDGLSEIEYLTQLCREGWKKKIIDAVPKEKWQEYGDRVKYEMSVFKEHGLAGYFLILWDILQFCHKENILTGPGRGSVGGSLVAYLIDIIKIDPIKYDLIFERFFDVSRKGSLPDIDTDFEINRREEILDYIRHKYGNNRVGQILTFQNLKGRKALTEVCRAYGDMTHEEIKQITKYIIEEHKISDELQEMEEHTGESSIIQWCLENRADKFKDWCYLEDGELKGQYADRFRQAIKLEGLKASQGRHPAGVVIAPETMEDICPMVLDTKNKNLIGGLTMNDMEAIGLVKLDILGLSALDKIKYIHELNPNFPVNVEDIDLEDDETWELLSSGRTLGCFQLESRFGSQSCKKLKPEHMEHLSALSSILRPGCLNAKKDDGKSVTDHYIMRKNGEEPITYIDPNLEPILNKYYGELIYQEQAMEIVKVLAGFSLEKANLLRKAIGKKKADLMAQMKKEFTEGVEKTQLITKEIGDQIFAWIEASQRYSFNKSHAVEYSHITYHTAYAKRHFTKEFFTAYLAFAYAKPRPQKEIYELVNDAKTFDIYVQPPRLDLLNEHFILHNNNIYFGLTDIKHVGKTVLDKLTSLLGTFKLSEWTWTDFLVKISQQIDSRAMESLIKAGACDLFKETRTKMQFECGLYSELTKKEQAWILDNYSPGQTLQTILEKITLIAPGRGKPCANKKRLEKITDLLSTLKNPPHPMDDLPHQIAQAENSLLGVCLTSNVLDEAKLKYMANCSCEEFNNGYTNRNSYVSIAAVIDDVKEHTIKNGMNSGRKMAFLEISDETGSCDNLVIFADAWMEFQYILEQGNRVLITGERSKDKNSLIIQNVEQI